jgi:hypothetical protein
LNDLIGHNGKDDRGLNTVFVKVNTQINMSLDTEYFVSKWEVIFEGTPGGDVKVILTIEEKEDSITLFHGYVQCFGETS